MNSVNERPLLDVNGLHLAIEVRDGSVFPLQGVDLRVDRGAMVGVVGESGSGKTLTALAVMGLLPQGARITDGQIAFDGTDLTSLSQADARRLRGTEIGMVFQDPLTSLNPTLRIGDQVAERLRVHLKMPKKEAWEHAVESLRRVGMPRPERIVRDYPHQLSGGMRQRVMIAMALVSNPQLLIADEPTTALDVTTQRQILDLIDELRQETGTAVVLVTHDLGVVAGRADRVAVMYGGRIVESGPTREIFHHAQHQYTRALMAALPDRAAQTGSLLYTIPGRPPQLTSQSPLCPFLDRCDRADVRCREQAPPVTPGDHSHTCHHPAGPPPVHEDEHVVANRIDASDVVLSVRGLSKRYPAMAGGIVRRRVGWVHAVSDVNLEVRAGETLGIVGESGCGKSTLGRLISALEPASDGSIEVAGVDITTLSRSERKRLHGEVQMMFQDSYAAMDPRMRIDEVLNEPLDIQDLGTTQQRSERVQHLLNSIGLDHDSLSKYPHEFSGGQLQRIGLARSLVLDPRLVVCDEPVSALDVSVQAQVLNLMRSIQHDSDLTYVFISHDLAVVRYVADRIAVMYLGKIVEIGPADDVVERPRHPYTQALIDAIPKVTDLDSPAAAAPLAGEPASAIDPPPGCRFRNRCPFAQDVCSSEPPLLGAAHAVACHFPLKAGGDDAL